MKWIGQHIYDLVSRFRDDVYLEDLSTTTETNVLVVDSTGKVSKSTTLADDIIEAEIDTLPGLISIGTAGTSTVFSGSSFQIINTTTSSTSQGGAVQLVSNDGAALGDDHRLGVVSFAAAEDASSTYKVGASIQAFADAAWSASENGTRLEFRTMDANAASELSLTLDSDLLATFAGAVTVTGALTGTLATAAQTNITSLGTLTALGVDDINLNGKTITITGDTEDTFSIVTGAAGATTLTTTDDNAEAGHFEIAADGDIILDSAGQIKLEPVAGNNILLDGTIAIDAGVVTGATSITSTAFVGDVSGGAWTGTAIAQAYIANDAINGDKIADDAIDSEHYTDGSIDTAHIADDQVTFAKAVGVTPNIYGSTIKILPSDFMANDDGGVTKTIQFVDENSSGLKPGNAGTELLAFVAVPEGMKVTLVDVYASSAFAVDVIALDIHQIVTDISAASIGRGNANTQINVTDTNSTATNFFMIQVTTTATSSRVYGALVTIAAQ